MKTKVDHPEVIRREIDGRYIRFRKLQGNVVYIAVADLNNLFRCGYISWVELRVRCNSCEKIVFYKGKNMEIYGIEAYDLQNYCKLGNGGQISEDNKKRIEMVCNAVRELKSCKDVEEKVEEFIPATSIDDSALYKVFQCEEFGKVRIKLDESNEPWFCLRDVCESLDISQLRANERLNDDVIHNHPIKDALGRAQLTIFVNEDGLYDVILESRKPEAKKFRKWITSEVLPSIRKHGAYMTRDTLEKALTSPDFLIQLATQLKEEQQKLLEAEKKNACLLEDNIHKGMIIEGLTEDIPLADMRQRITQIVRKAGGSEVRGKYHLLYQEFNMKYHMNIHTRMNNIEYSGNAMDYIEKELHMLPQLYDLTCKLFEASYEALLKSWGKTLARPNRNERDLNRRQDTLMSANKG